MPRFRPLDDDDDDVKVRRGRPCAPEEFGPPKPEPYQVKAYCTRVQSILDALEIPEIGRDERLNLQRILWRTDRLRAFDPKRFPASGDDRIILLLRSIAETTNGSAALTLPVIGAVGSCLHEAWTERGLAWLEAMDRVPLLEIQATLRGLGLEEHLGQAIRFKLTEILGSPIAAPKRVQKKPASKKLTPPPGVSPAAWRATSSNFEKQIGYD